MGKRKKEKTRNNETIASQQNQGPSSSSSGIPGFEWVTQFSRWLRWVFIGMAGQANGVGHSPGTVVRRRPTERGSVGPEARTGVPVPLLCSRLRRSTYSVRGCDCIGNREEAPVLRPVEPPTGTPDEPLLPTRMPQEPWFLNNLDRRPGSLGRSLRLTVHSRRFTNLGPPNG